MDPKTSKYEMIWKAEDNDNDECLSETDVESGNEKEWHDEPPARKWGEPRGILSTIKAYTWIMNTALLVVIAGLLTLLLLREPHRRQLGTDFTSSSQEFSTKVIKWNADLDLVPSTQAAWYSDAVMEKWSKLLPAGAATANTTTFKATSMTHSLHCLFMMGRMYSALQDGKPELIPEGGDTHYFHCIDYIRQSVMCAGDVALEPHTEHDGADNGPLDGGWNGIHVCKNYDEVTNYLERQIVDGTRLVLPIDD